MAMWNMAIIMMKRLIFKSECHFMGCSNLMRVKVILNRCCSQRICRVLKSPQSEYCWYQRYLEEVMSLSSWELLQVLMAYGECKCSVIRRILPQIQRIIHLYLRQRLPPWNQQRSRQWIRQWDQRPIRLRNRHQYHLEIRVLDLRWSQH